MLDPACKANPFPRVFEREVSAFVSSGRPAQKPLRTLDEQFPSRI
jgi:hypothetical protein